MCLHFIATDYLRGDKIFTDGNRERNVCGLSSLLGHEVRYVYDRLGPTRHHFIDTLIKLSDLLNK